MSLTLLNDDEIREGLLQLDGWTREGPEIMKRYGFPDYAASMAFANRVAELAEAADHHPDMLITYDQVTLTLATHSAGGLTRKDLELAGRIEREAAPER
ncbi:MAG: 4a-hydroxytetrahydrobiopterin dehydratase [Gemmatimonadota bacterium]